MITGNLFVDIHPEGNCLWQIFVSGLRGRGVQVNKHQIRNSFLLLLTATIWGSAFVAQSVAMDHIGPFTFLCVRSFIGGLVLIPCIWLLNRGKSAQIQSADEAAQTGGRKDLIIGGICCGFFLFTASATQQIGIMNTSVGKAGFLTACYILIVPILGIFIGKKCGKLVWIGVGFALVGLYLLCMTEKLTIGRADIWVLSCAVLFSFHIMTIDHFVVKADGVKMSCIQFFVCGIFSGIFMLALEEPQIANIIQAGGSILYAGVLSSGVGYTLQIVGQKDMNPTVASLIMSLESVMSVIAGFIVLHQVLTGRELLGCVFMFCAIILAQIPEKQKIQ